MKKTSVIIGILGLGALCEFFGAFFEAGTLHRLLSVFGGLLGILLIAVAVGLWEGRLFAWRLGFVAIIFAAVLFLAEVSLELPAVSTTEKIIILSSSLIGGALVAAFWSVVWYRRRSWFTTEKQRAEPHAGG
jgi:hypothetical protein